MYLSDYAMQVKALKKLIPTDKEIDVIYNIDRHHLNHFSIGDYVRATKDTMTQSHKVIITMTSKGILTRHGRYSSMGNDSHTYTLNSDYNISSINRALKLKGS